jgi:transcription antitermination factor NusG
VQFAPEKMKQVMFTQGVSTIVMRIKDTPADVPQSVMDELFALAPTGIIKLDIPPLTLSQRVRCLDGAFTGFEGKVVGLAPEMQRVDVLLSFLGDERPVTLDAINVGPPDPNPRNFVNFTTASQRR